MKSNNNTCDICEEALYKEGDEMENKTFCIEIIKDSAILIL